LRTLVEQYLGAGNAEHAPSLLASIEAMAGEAADKSWYLQTVSAALAARAELDLDAILAEDAETAGQRQARASDLAAAADEDASLHAGPTVEREADSHAGAAGAAPAADTLAGLDIATWRQRIARALIGGDAQLIAEHRQALLTERRGLLHDALRHYGRSEAVRQALVRGFPDALLADFVELLEPRASRFAAAVRAHPAPSRAGAGADGTSLWPAWRQRFWSQLLEASMSSHAAFDAVLATLDGGEQAAPFAQRWLDAIHAAPHAGELRARARTVAPSAQDAIASAASPTENGAAGGEAGDREFAAIPHASHVDAFAALPARALDQMAADKQDGAAVDQALATSMSASGMDADALSSLARALDAMTADGGGELPHWLAAALAVPASRARIVAALPDRLLTRILLALRPEDHAAIQRGMDLVAAAYARVRSGAPAARLWDSVFAYLFEHRRHYTEAGLANWLAASAGSGLGEAGRAELARLAVDSVAEPDPPGGAERGPVPQAGAGSEADEPLELLFLANAGMVLAAPYLPRLFSMLALTENGCFVDRAAAERAVHLLQFMVDARTSAPEYQLVLNKLLCGVATGVPIAAGIEITDHERQTIESLLQAMIANWTAIGNTSIDGLRETFLRRKGSIQLRDDAWQLQVQPATFDMLLDRLPWSFSIVKYPWMERPLHVTWR
jgi:hypothetical protein